MIDSLTKNFVFMDKLYSKQNHRSVPISLSPLLKLPLVAVV